jgi:hypothetical protein
MNAPAFIHEKKTVIPSCKIKGRAREGTAFVILSICADGALPSAGIIKK